MAGQDDNNNNGGDGKDDDEDKTVFMPSPGPTPPDDENEDDNEKTVFMPRTDPEGGDDASSTPPSSSPAEGWDDEPASPPPASEGWDAEPEGEQEQPDPAEDPAPPQPEETTPEPPPAAEPPPNPSAFPNAGAIPPNPSAFPGAPGSASEPIRPIEVGDYVNVFRVDKFIARGGMGEVWEAVNPHPPHERVAVKIMLPDLARDENVLNMFYKEASALGRLHHENIVQYRIASQGPNGQPYLITEFVDGPSLEAQLGKFKPDEKQLKKLTQRLSRGLGAAHAQGVVHRDIAPDNILLVGGDPERPKIIDFGIVKDTQENNATIIGDGFAGKLRYVAPEQLGEYNLNVGPWTDIYSLALTMLAVASGDHANMGGSISDAVLKRREVPDLSAIPENLRPAFTAALQPNPADRPQTMAEFSSLLDKGATAAVGALDTPLNPDDDTASEGDGPPVDGKKDKSGLLADPSKKRIVYGGVGVLAVLAILVGVIVIATMPDEIPDEDIGAGPIASGTSQPATRAASVEEIAAAAMADVDCAWLTFEGNSGSTIQFSGGAARPGAVQTALEAAFAANGMPNATPDTRGLVTFGEDLCPMVDALRTARSERALISSPQDTYEISNQESVFGGTDDFAKVVLQSSGLDPDDEVMLLYIDDAEAGVFANNREKIGEYVRAFQGSMTTTGFQVNVEYEGEGGKAFMIVTGQPEFPRSLFPRADDQGDEVGVIPVSADWARQFERESREKGWRTDILWFRITDSMPN